MKPNKAQTKVTKSKKKPSKKSDQAIFKNVLIRMPIFLLEQIDDEVAKHPWISRTQLIIGLLCERFTQDAEEHFNS